MEQSAQEFVNTLAPNSKVVGEIILCKAHDLGYKSREDMNAFEKEVWKQIDKKFPNKVELGNFGLGRTVVLL